MTTKPTNYDEAQILYRACLNDELRICSLEESPAQEEKLLEASTKTNAALRLMTTFRPSMMVG